MEKLRASLGPSLPPVVPFRVPFPRSNRGDPVVCANAPITGQEKLHYSMLILRTLDKEIARVVIQLVHIDAVLLLRRVGLSRYNPTAIKLLQFLVLFKSLAISKYLRHHHGNLSTTPRYIHACTSCPLRRHRPLPSPKCRIRSTVRKNQRSRSLIVRSRIAVAFSRAWCMRATPYRASSTPPPRAR